MGPIFLNSISVIFTTLISIRCSRVQLSSTTFSLNRRALRRIAPLYTVLYWFFMRRNRIGRMKVECVLNKFLTEDRK